MKEDCVNVHLSLQDNGILSVRGWGMNKLGMFALTGEGMKSDTAGSAYKVMLRKDYIYEVCAKVWKWHSVNEEGQSALCAGEVASFDVKKSIVRVYFYIDGKSERISKDIAITIERTAVPPKKNSDLQPIAIGARIAKYFLLESLKTHKYLRRVISCHLEKNLLAIEYDDGTQEALEEDVVRRVQILDNPECLPDPLAAPFPLEPVVHSTHATTNAPKSTAGSHEVVDLTTSSNKDEDAFDTADVGGQNKKQ